jgi:hypothetical protein
VRNTDAGYWSRPAGGKKEDLMAESVRLLSSLAIDGRALRCEHAVLLLAEPPADEWFVALLGVAESDLQRLPGRHLASLADTCDGHLDGMVEVAAGQTHSHVRLRGAGRLHDSSRAPGRPAAGPYALPTPNA